MFDPRSLTMLYAREISQNLRIASKLESKEKSAQLANVIANGRANVVYILS